MGAPPLDSRSLCRSQNCHTKRHRSLTPAVPCAVMDQETRRELGRLKRLLWRIYAELPPGAPPPRVDERMEEELAPGYGGRALIEPS